MTGPQVRLVDRSDAGGERTLLTRKTTYDFRDGVARYAGGGEVRTQGEQITSERGSVLPRLWSDGLFGASGNGGRHLDGAC